MDRTAYSRALRAAAQVSFVALAGCAGAAATEPTDMNEEAACKGGTSGKAPPRTSAKDAGGAADATSAAAPDAAPLSCDAKLKAAFPKGDPDWFDQPDVQNADLAACCNALAKAIDPAKPTSTEEFRASGCCSIKDVVEGTMACTPWGPPMPPSIADWVHEVQPVAEPAWC